MGLRERLLARATPVEVLDPEQSPVAPANLEPPRRPLSTRFADSARGAWSGWFGPGQPIQPLAPPEATPRALDYPVGYNLRYTPRGEEPLSFQQLQMMSRACDILRLAIETRKDQISAVKWQIQPRDGYDNEDGIIELTEFLLRPDRQEPWRTWLRRLLEDVLVIDAASIFIRRTRSGAPYALEPMDGATIRPMIDESGRRPLVGPAWQQIIKGLPAFDLTSDNFIYAPRNPTNSRIYGFSPTEQVIFTVNIALKRMLSQDAYYTDGNLPDALIQVPDTWSPKQIEDFAKRWDAMYLGGDPVREKRRARFTPAGAIHELRLPPLKDDFDEWLARVVSFAFSLPPTWAVKMMNRGTAQIAQDTATEEGLMPLMEWWADVMTYSVLWGIFGRTDLEFVWQDIKPPDPKTQAEVNDIYVRNGVKSVDEVRDELGFDAIEQPNAIITPTGMIPIGAVGEAQRAEEEQRKAEMAATIAAGQQPPGGKPPTPPPADGDKPAAGPPARVGDDPVSGLDEVTNVARPVRKVRRFVSAVPGVKKNSSLARAATPASLRAPRRSSPR